MGRVPISSFLEALEVHVASRDRVFFCSGVQGLRMVDVSDPASPTTSDALRSALSDATYPRCQHVAASGDIVFFTNRGDEVQPRAFLSAIDVSSSPPVEVALHTREGFTFEGVAATEDLVFLAQHEQGVAVLARSGDTLLERATIADLSNAWHVATSGDTLYVADGAGGLVVVDVADPIAPAVVARAPTGGAAQYLVVDEARDLVFVAAGSEGVLLFDVADPTAPSQLSRIDTPGSALQVSVSGTLVSVADWNDVRLYDTRDPRAPLPFATERPETVGPFTRVLGTGAIDDLVFVSEWTGFHVYRVHRDREAPDLFIAGNLVSFGSVTPGEAAARAVLVANHGNAPLVINAAGAKPEPFAVTGFEAMTLAPGERGVVEVEARPARELETIGALEVCSDDADQPRRPHPLIVNRLGTGVGDRAPPTNVELVSGETFRVADQEGRVVVLAYFATF